MDATERLRPLTNNTNLDEYLRRNLVVAKAEGVRAGIWAAITRLEGRKKRGPQWLLHILWEELRKQEDVIAEVVEHREEVVG